MGSKRTAWQGPYFVRSAERLRLSSNGNPRFRVVLEDVHGDIITAQTMSDASVGYEIDNYTRRDQRHIARMVDFTPAGRIRMMRVANPADCMRRSA